GQVIKTERKKWVTEAVKGKNLLVIVGLGLVLGLNSGFDKSKVDSLKTILSQSTSDTTLIQTLLKIGRHFHYSEPDTAFKNYDEALSIAKGNNNQKLTARCNNLIGSIYNGKSDYPQALQYFFRSLKINQQLKEKRAIAGNYNNIGIIYDKQSESPKALEYYLKALKINKEMGNKQWMANNYDNIGSVHRIQSDYPQALAYFFLSLKTREEIDNKQGMANSYNNIGIIYYLQSEYTQALNYYFKSLHIFEDLDMKQFMATCFSNIGNIYNDQSEFPLALEYYLKALETSEKLRDKRVKAFSYSNIGNLYVTIFEQASSNAQGISGQLPGESSILDTALIYQQKAFAIFSELSEEYGMSLCLSSIGNINVLKKDYQKALNNYHQSALLADSIRALKEESEAHSGLSTCYEKLNNHKLALNHYKKYSTLKDSIFNEEKSKDLGKLEAKHEFEMAELQKKQQEEELAKIETARISRRNDLQHSAILIGIFILFGSLFLLGKLSIPNWLVELSVFIPFLILFEFLLVLLDPSIESWTGSEPAYKLIFNAGLAGMMFPLHQFFEGKLKQRIVKAQRLKLKKRMEQFRRDVEEL
ncbi:MAG: tetratricopeptide repeat protein, partial [Bacteroidia bacterium]|nr:tetratricopeptide repeat protein [Bacteroidia bacterium]